MSALSLAIILSLAKDAACVASGVPAEYYVAVVQQESSGDPLALHDDTTNTPYHPTTLDEAERVAKGLLAQGRSVGIGLGQLTARSEPAFETKFGLTIREALENPCANMRAGSALLQRGLRAALSSYNCGAPDCAPGYVRQVLARVSGVGAQNGKEAAAVPPPLCDDDDWHVSRACQSSDDWASEREPDPAPVAVAAPNDDGTSTAVLAATREEN